MKDKIKGLMNILSSIGQKQKDDKKSLELRKLAAEAELAEQQALRQKLQNFEIAQRLQLSSGDVCADCKVFSKKELETLFNTEV